MSYTKKVLFLIFSVIIFHVSQAQCNRTQDISICAMETIDSDTGTPEPDGVINLYDEYTTATGLTVQAGTWSVDPRFAVALDGSTGNVSLWALRNATQITNPNDYVFELRNTDCGTDVALTIRLILGPYSGVALPPFGTNSVNIEICDEELLNLFNTLVSDDAIPPPHLNGEWTYTGASSSFQGITNSIFLADIPYNEGLPLVDQEVFEVTYTVAGVTPCAPSQSTTIRISVVNQVDAGIPATIDICEDTLLAGTYDADINLRDDQYLIDENVEGIWLSDQDLTGQLTNEQDSFINLRAVYDNLIDSGNNLRFGCESFDYTYKVEQRSGVCGDRESTIVFNMYEQLRPFNQTVSTPRVCANDSGNTTSNLFDLLSFTTEGSTGFIYDTDCYVNWRLVSGPSDLGIITQTKLDVLPDSDCTNTSVHLGTVTTLGASPGIYTFEYGVSPEINCQSSVRCDPFASIGDPGYCETVCNILTATVTIEILGFDYAGEDTSVGFCETAGTIDLRSVLGTNGTAITATGIWTDALGATINNTFTIPILPAPETFNFTYTTTSSDGCIDTAALALTISPLAGAGIAEDTTVVCANNRTITLFDQLTGNPNNTGIWTGPNGYTSPDHLGVFEENNISLPVLGEGAYIYTVLGSSECAFDDKTTLNITIVEPVDIGNDRSETFCKLDGRVNLFSLLDRDTNRTGTFEDTNATGALAADGVVEFESLTNGIYDFRYVVNNTPPCVESSLTVSVQIVDLPIPNVSNQEFCILDGKQLDDVVVDVLNYNWYETLESTTPILNNPLLFDEQVYYIANVDIDNCESERLAVQINILNTGERSSTGELCTIEFQDGVSPNGDIQNDTFDLNIEERFNIPIAFPDFELKIFNRYGTPVYTGNQNTEEFRGESNLSIRLGDDLPSGTYFYIFEPNFENNLPIQGSFYLSR